MLFLLLALLYFPIALRVIRGSAYMLHAGHPDKLFEIYDWQKKDLLELKGKYGAIVLAEQAEEWSASK